MASNTQPVLSLHNDILVLIFEQLTGDKLSLCNVGLTSRVWRSLSLPHLLHTVDISSHNNGRLPEFECKVMPVVYADFSARFRPRNLISRQRAFLRLMTAKPNLIKYVKSLTWTLVWMDFEDCNLIEIDRKTWDVFSQMDNVTQLDLASLHEICDEDFVRQNPARLFPAVTNLRLLGWMHRGLARAIVTSLDASRLHSLKLDYLQDEGALPNNALMSMDFATEHAPSASNTDTSDLIDDKLFQRQEAGKACMFPGPMWLPLRLLSTCPLNSLKYLQVKAAPLNMDHDLRNYYSLFHDTAEVMFKARESLTSLLIIFGEHPAFHGEMSKCGTAQMYMRYRYHPWCVKMAAAFLNESLVALSKSPFPHLKNVHFEGFRILETASQQEFADAQLDSTFRSIRNCPIPDASFTDLSSVDYRPEFFGLDGGEHTMDGLVEILANS